MPTIDSKNKKIIYDEKDWLAGLHPNYGAKTIPQKFGKFSRQQYAFNPFDDLGCAKNAFLNTDFAHEDRVTSNVIKMIQATSGTYYGIDAKNKAYSFSAVGGASSDVLNTNNMPYTIDANGVNSDIVQHFAGNAKINVIFVSYNNNANGDVYAYSLDDYTSSTDYMTTRPATPVTFSKLYPHPLCIGHDDNLYIGDGRSLHCYDYSDVADADGKVFASVLTLPENYIIKSIIKIQPRSLVVFAQNGLLGSGGNVKAFFWDYLSLDPYQIEDVGDSIIVNSFDYKGTIGCLVHSYNSSRMNIKIFDGSEFNTLFRLRNMDTGDSVEPVIGSVDVNENEIYVHVTDQLKGYVYKYGNNNGFANTLNVVAKSTAGVAGYYAGFVKYIPYYKSLCFSTGLTDATSATIQYTDTSKYVTDGYWYSDLADLGDERIQVKQITVYFADEFTGGRTISVSLTDRYNTYAIAGLTTLATVTPENRIYKAKPFLNTTGTLIPPLDGFGLKLDWGTGAGSSATPIINKIIIDYEPIKIN